MNEWALFYFWAACMLGLYAMSQFKFAPKPRFPPTFFSLPFMTGFSESGFTNGVKSK